VSEDGRGAWHGGDDGRRGSDLSYDAIRASKRDLRAWLAGGIRRAQRVVWEREMGFWGLGMPAAAESDRGGDRRGKRALMAASITASGSGAKGRMSEAAHRVDAYTPFLGVFGYSC
jgi:hypothetical protein